MPTTDELPPEPRVQPKIEQIIALLTPGGDLENAEKGQGEAMSAIGNLYRKIEKDLKGNRAAVSAIRKMQKMSADKRNDYIRTLEPLLVAFKYTLDDIDPDLADQAAAQTPTAPKADDDDAPPEDDSTGAGSNGIRGGLEAARAHLAGVAPAKAGVTEDQANDFVAKANAGKPTLAAGTPKKDGVDK